MLRSSGAARARLCGSFLSCQASTHPIMHFSSRLTKHTSQRGKQWCYSNTELLISPSVSPRPALPALWFSFFFFFFLQFTSCFSLCCCVSLGARVWPDPSVNNERGRGVVLSFLRLLSACGVAGWFLKMQKEIPRIVHRLKQRVEVRQWLEEHGRGLAKGGIVPKDIILLIRSLVERRLAPPSHLPAKYVTLAWAAV